MRLKRSAFYILFLMVIPVSLFAQDTVKVMTYNLLNYGTDTTRHKYYRTIIRNANPDILVVEEMTSQTAVNTFLAKVLNLTGNTYAAGTFIDGPDTDNAIFYKQSKFIFLNNKPIATDLRDITQFKILHVNHPSDTLFIYASHLKASEGSANEVARSQEIDSLRKVTNALRSGSLYIFLGDCNIYKSSEQAYVKLLAVNPDNKGHFIDPIVGMTGTWNNASYAPYHTQSPRVRQFGGGSNGGMDDRFDLLIFSPAISTTGNIKYVPNSLTAYGNDGLHFNDSINRRPNAAVADSVADAIHYASDHIPVYAKFVFAGPLPVELSEFSYLLEERKVLLSWSTSEEMNNSGFFIQRKAFESDWTTIGFVSGYGNSNVEQSYKYTDNNLSSGRYNYRLKQSDVNGNEHYYDLNTEVVIGVPRDFKLYQNYPNPFNPETKIDYSLPLQSKVVVSVFDINGRKISELKNEVENAGYHSVNFNASGLASGTYFYKLEASSGDFYFAKTMKMVIIK